jgi:hypothetical protein
LFRSIPLALFAPLAQDRVELISLQHDPGCEQLDLVAGKFRVRDFGQAFDREPGGFMNVAAMMHALDLVITIDTAAAHLAGALGLPVWVALPFSPDWRWQLARDDSPWYPTMRLFRQPRPRDWQSVMARIAGALRQVSRRNA